MSTIIQTIQQCVYKASENILSTQQIYLYGYIYPPPPFPTHFRYGFHIKHPHINQYVKRLTNFVYTDHSD